MPKRWQQQRLYVVDVGNRFAANRRLGLGGHDESLTATRPRTKPDVLLNLSRCTLKVGARRASASDGQAHGLVRYWNSWNESPEGAHVFNAHDRLYCGRRSRGCLASNLELLLFCRIVDVNFQQKAIQLCLREWVGSLLLDGIARREDLKRIGQLVCGAPSSDLPLLHRLQQCGLSLRWRAIDLVSEHQVLEDRSLHEAQLAAYAPLRLDLVKEVSPSDVGRQQIRCELNPSEGHSQCLRNTAHQEGFR